MATDDLHEDDIAAENDATRQLVCAYADWYRAQPRPDVSTPTALDERVAREYFQLVLIPISVATPLGEVRGLVFAYQGQRPEGDPSPIAVLLRTGMLMVAYADGERPEVSVSAGPDDPD